MRIKILILSVFIISSFTSTAQQYHPFPTDSAQWSVRHTHNNPFYQNTFQYKMKGDTVINSITYHKIYCSLDLDYSSTNQTLHCFLREDNAKKVFVKYPTGSGIDTTEFVLYDFNYAAGDTATIKLLYYTTDSIFKLKVFLPIDSMPTYNGFRNYYTLYPINPPLWGGNCDINFVCVEGIGAYTNLFYNEIPEGGCDYSDDYYLTCFWQNGVYVMGGSECDVNININDVNNYITPKVYPNPATNYLTIEIFQKSTIEITTIEGKIITTINNAESITTIDLKGLSGGVYILKIMSKNRIETKKFIKEL